jgi:CMP-N-acetylneuraminic acid synthetase
MKAHSARVQGKNFRLLGNKPLFRWILDSLLEVPAISRVVINTDARQELFAHGLSESDRLSIRDRKPELCGDLVSMNLVLEDDVLNVAADTYLMTHATNPLLRPETIERALGEYHAHPTADSLFSVTRMQTRFYRADGSAVNHNPNELLRTQDLEPWFEENSCLYLFSRESFVRRRARIGLRPLLFETPALESIDIDEPDDWTLAEALVEWEQRRG